MPALKCNIQEMFANHINLKNEIFCLGSFLKTLKEQLYICNYILIIIIDIFII